MIGHIYEWVLSKVWIRQATTDAARLWSFDDCFDTYQWNMSHISKSHVTHMSESCHIYERVMSHIWISHATTDAVRLWYFDDCTDTYQWVMSHLWVSHVTHMSESCHIRERVMSHKWLRQATTDAARLWSFDDCTDIYQWVMSYIWMSHVTNMHESCHIYERVMSLIWISHATTDAVRLYHSYL